MSGKPESKVSSTRPGDQTIALPSGAVEAPVLEKQHAGLVVIQGREICREYRLRRSESILGREEGVTLRIAEDRKSTRLNSSH